MYHFPIGIFLNAPRYYESKEALIAAMKNAAALGVEGVQLGACIEFDAADSGFRRDIKNAADALGLKIASICGDFGIMFHELDRRETLYKNIKQVYDIALELGTNIVTTHIGPIPTDPAHPRYGVMQETFAHIAEHAASLGAYLANETGPEPAPVLKAFLDSIGSPAAAVNFDPANVVMSTGEKAEDAARILGSYIVHTHAKDGVLFKLSDLEVMYGVKKDPSYRERDYCREVIIGTGEVNWTAYLNTLCDIGYTGYLTIEREGSPSHDADVAEEVTIIKKMLAK